MLTRKLIFLFILPILFVVSLDVASANEVRVQTGNLQVSVQDGAVEINSSPTRIRRPLSLRDRLYRWRVFGSRRRNLGKCEQHSSTTHRTHTSPSGNSISQSSSSSSTTVCN